MSTETTTPTGNPADMSSPAASSFMSALAERVNNPSPAPVSPAPAPPNTPAASPAPVDEEMQRDLAEAARLQQEQEAASKAPPVPAPEASKAPVETVAKETRQGLDAFDDATEPDPAAKPPEADEEPPAGVRTKEAREAWKSMREGAKKAAVLERQLAEMQEKLKTAGQITDADPAVKKAAELEKRLAEIEPIVNRVAYQKSQAYKETIEAPRARVAAEAVNLGKLYEISPDKIDAAFSEPNPRKQNELLEELAGTMDERSKQKLYRLVDDWEGINRKDDEMEQHAAIARKEAEAVEAQNQSKAATEKKAAEMRAVVDLKPKLQAVAKLLAPDGTTPDAYVESLINAANATPFDEHETGQKAYLSVAAQVLKDMAPAYKNALAKIKSLEAQVAGMSASRPGVTGTQANQGNSGQPVGFMDALKQRMEAAGRG